ncbi:CAP domain-containing protein [Lutibacter sp.]
MKSIRFRLVLLLFVTTLQISCTKNDDEIDLSALTETTYEYSKIELDILDLVNKHREGIGLLPLNKLDIISAVAFEHTDYMVKVNRVNHDFFAERQEELVTKAKAKSVGENVAFGYSTAEEVVSAWLQSASHKSLIENPNFTHFGVSTKQNSNGINYFTQLFIKQ